MKVFVKGKGEIELDKKDFINSGGEGDIYKHGRTVYKLYHDHKNMLPYEKIQELSLIKDQNVIIPQ